MKTSRLFKVYTLKISIRWKNNNTSYLLIFDKSGDLICHSMALGDIATAGGHRGLSNIDNKHNLFQQSKVVRDIWDTKHSISSLQIWCDSSQYA